VYVQLDYSPTEHRYCEARECKVDDRGRQKYWVPEHECDNCESFYDGDYEFFSDWDLRSDGRTHLGIHRMFLVLTVPRSQDGTEVPNEV